MVIIRVHMRYLDRSTHQLPITGNAAKLAAPLGASADGGPELVHRFGAAVVQQGKTQRSAKGLAGAVAGALFKARVDVLDTALGVRDHYSHRTLLNGAGQYSGLAYGMPTLLPYFRFAQFPLHGRHQPSQGVFVHALVGALLKEAHHIFGGYGARGDDKG